MHQILPCGRIQDRFGLGFLVPLGPADGIICIHGGRRKCFFGFLERDQQGIGFDILEIQHACILLPGQVRSGRA